MLRSVRINANSTSSNQKESNEKAAQLTQTEAFLACTISLPIHFDIPRHRYTKYLGDSWIPLYRAVDVYHLSELQEYVSGPWGTNHRVMMKSGFMSAPPSRIYGRNWVLIMISRMLGDVPANHEPRKCPRSQQNHRSCTNRLSIVFQVKSRHST